jgi:hypothetical protein
MQVLVSLNLAAVVCAFWTGSDKAVQIVPALLFRVYICIAFNWNVHKLGYLQQVCICACIAVCVLMLPIHESSLTGAE